MTKIAIIAACAALLAGCAASTNMRIGTEQPYTSLQAQRDAARSVVVLARVPDGAQVTGQVDASRCHRNQGAIEPTEENIKDDLVAAAYARGADGIAEIAVSSSVGLGYNCWYILTGRATMFRKESIKAPA